LAGGLVVLVGQFGLALKGLAVEFKLVSAEAATARGALLAFGGTAAIVLAPVVIIGALVAWKRLTDQIGAANEATSKFGESARGLADAQIKANQDIIRDRQEAVREAIKLTSEDFRKREVAYQKDKAEALRAQEDISSDFKAQLEERSNALTSFLSALRDVQKEAPRNIQKIQAEGLNLEFQVNTDRFERDFKQIADVPAGFWPCSTITASFAAQMPFKVMLILERTCSEGAIAIEQQMSRETLPVKARLTEF
jgi:hypothetical protein